MNVFLSDAKIIALEAFLINEGLLDHSAVEGRDSAQLAEVDRTSTQAPPSVNSGNDVVDNALSRMQNNVESMSLHTVTPVVPLCRRYQAQGTGEGTGTRQEPCEALLEEVECMEAMVRRYV